MFSPDLARFLRWLSIEAEDPEQVVESMFWHILDFQDVPLSKPNHQSTEYTLMLSRTPMSHKDKEFNVGGFFLVFLPDTINHTAKTTLLQNASDWKILSIPASTNTSVPAKAVQAILVPLGWLVESGIEQGRKFKRITNYTVLLNISTDPISLWLAYDYYPTVDLDMTIIVQLSNSEYFNPDYHSQDPKPAQRRATNPLKKERKPDDRTNIRGKVLQASGLEAFIDVHGPIGAEIDPYDLPFIAKQEILEKYQYLVLSQAKNKPLLSTPTERRNIQEKARYLLEKKDVNQVLDEEELQTLHSYMAAPYVQEDQQKIDEHSTEQAEEPAYYHLGSDTAPVSGTSPVLSDPGYKPD